MTTPLHAWRQRMGWSQLEAARQLDVAASTYIAWERETARRSGDHLPPPRTAILAAAALEAGITELRAVMLEG